MGSTAESQPKEDHAQGGASTELQKQGKDVPRLLQLLEDFDSGEKERDKESPENDFSNADLSHGDFEGKDLTGINFSAKDRFGGGMGTAVNLENANLIGANLENANLIGANLQYANLRGANLENADLNEANLRAAHVNDAHLKYANLRRANLENADLNEANLRAAHVNDANLKGANLQNANLVEANLQNSDLNGANLENAKLINANLRNADLRGANLQNADLNAAKLENAGLNGAKLQYANLNGANFEGANLEGANFEGGTDDSPTLDVRHKSTIGGTDDSPTLDPDRLGYFIYAEALSNMIRKVESPHNSICGALYGPWGKGKTFLHKLIQQVQDKKTKEALEKLYRELEVSMQKQDAQICQRSMRRSLQWLCHLATFMCKCSCCSPALQTESVAARIAVVWPLWFCLFIMSYPLSFLNEVRVLVACLYCKCKKDDDNEAVSQADENVHDHHKKAQEEAESENLLGAEEGLEKGVNQKDDTCISWSNVWDILTGVSSLHERKHFHRRTCIEKIQFFFLCCMRPFMKIIDKLCKWVQWSFTCGQEEEFKVHHAATIYINISFNAWVCNGTELLWASLLEEMWTKVEAEFGKKGCNSIELVFIFPMN
jgi:uncharacterized protein YjbI with pentapeptide repeats